MRRQFFDVAVLFALSYASAAAALPKPAAGHAAIRLLEKYEGSEASFEQNVGQAPAGTGFVGRGLTYSLSLNARGAVLETQANGKVNRAVELVLQNASESSVGTGVKRLPVRTSYIIGSDSSKWLENVPTFEKVRFSQVWPGIDVVYYGTHNQLEYDFVVHAGADTDAIRLQFKGARNVRLNGDGDLVLDTRFGELVQHRPRIYQKIGEHTTDVAGRYAIGADHSVTVEVQRYDKSSDLIVDPVLSFARVLDPHYSSATGVFADASGNSYYVGSGSIQLAPGVVQVEAYVFKLDPNGNQAGVSATFGGTNGPTVANGVAVDASGNVYVTGSTSATDFTAVGGFQPALAEGSPNGATDAFLVKLNPALTGVLYGTYIGGPGNDVGNAVAVDNAGNAYVAGQTSSASFPKTVGPAFRANGTTGFATKINTNATGASSRVWATYLGGTGTDFARGISVDGAGNVTVGGSTTSSDFLPSSSTGFDLARTGQDGFLVTLNAAGSAASYFTYFPLAPINGIAGAGSVIYATGLTNGNIVTTSTGFQLSGGAGHAFLAKFNTAVGGANSLLYSSYLGGAVTEIGKSVAADANGNASVVGQTSSTNFPTTAGAVAIPSPSNPPDGFLSTINTNASGSSGLVYSTLLGGNNFDSTNGVSVDGFGNIFATGFTLSNNFVGSGNFAGLTPGGNA
ncbi:MAG: SBBP repeat-containing protein, partial [Acidobacteriota bacterium]|nr:SBBP repeat-containing protein [Acidobacteriota bacterium]